MPKILGISRADDEKKLKVTVEKAEIVTDQAVVTANAVIRAENGQSLVDVTGEVLQDIERGILVDIEVKTETEKPGEFKPLLKAEDIDFCNYEKNSTMAPLLDLFLKDMSSFGNLPLKCPIKKGPFGIKGFHLGHDSLPSYTPEARYLIESKIYIPKDGDDHHTIYNSKWIALIVRE
uniref:Uncharacterized protein n=1 Tax=Phlebotomus papatasi TaxID=29031 RepID=A0A1B0D671_PHLPP